MSAQRWLLVWLPLLVAYLPTLGWCIDRWNAPTQYFAHGWLVPPAMAFLLWRARARWSSVGAAWDRRGLWLLGPALLLHLVGAGLMVDSWSAASLVLAVPGAAWWALGRARLAGHWPVLWLVLFAVPAPLFVEGRLAFFLKEIAVQYGASVGNLLGAEVVRHGDRLQPTGLSGSLHVADACGGLRSLLAMQALAYGIAFFTGAGRWSRRMLLLVAAPLLAVLANTLRIAALCLLARWFGVPFAEGTGHTLANTVEWASLLLALLGVDALWARLGGKTPTNGPAAGSGDAGLAPPVATPDPAVRAIPTALRLVFVWAIAVGLAGLCWYRPAPSSTTRASTLPEALGGFTLVPRSPVQEARFARDLPRYVELLGTGDFVWRTYRDPEGGTVAVVALFHDSNWKSVHPPRICIEGSDMDIEQDDFTAAWPDGPVASRIVARARRSGRRFVTLSLFGTADWLSGDYWQFTLHHLPRAVVRANQSGFLLRAEAPIGDGDSDALAEQRAARFLQALVPIAQERLR